MWLVLCDPTDRAALWAYAGLRDRGLVPLELISPHALVCSRRSVHRVDSRGARFEIDLPDGRRLSSGEVDGVLNRLSTVPVEHLVFDSEAETRYAVEELHALVLSWMACVGAVAVNRPSPRGLAGAWRSPAEWAMLARQAGLPTRPLRLSSLGARRPPESLVNTRSLIVLGRHTFGDPVPESIGGACVTLAALAETDVLGVELCAHGDGGLAFAGATPLPDLRRGGDAFIAALHRHLIGLRASRG